MAVKTPAAVPTMFSGLIPCPCKCGDKVVLSRAYGDLQVAACTTQRGTPGRPLATFYAARWVIFTSLVNGIRPLSA